MKDILIGYDAKRIARNATGLGNYCRTLVADMSALLPQCRLRLYMPDLGRAQLLGQLPEAQNIEFALPQSARSAAAKALWRSWGVTRQLALDGVKIYHGLSGELPLGLRRAGIPAVATVHDLIFMRHPEYYNRIDVAFYRLKFRAMCREAGRIIAISECTKRDIMELGGVEESRIDVVYQSCAPRFTTEVADELCLRARSELQLPPRYILNVGTVEQRKNVMLALDALTLLPDDLHLVVVGRPTAYADKLRQRAQKLGLAARLHLLSGVGNDILPAVYHMAETFVYPSRYEGFGLPIIEAIQSGLPVVACTGSCLEEAGGPDSLYVGPDDVNGMADAIKTTLQNGAERTARIGRSREWVRRFENTNTAAKVAGVYEKLLGE